MKTISGHFIWILTQPAVTSSGSFLLPPCTYKGSQEASRSWREPSSTPPLSPASSTPRQRTHTHIYASHFLSTLTVVPLLLPYDSSYRDFCAFMKTQSITNLARTLYNPKQFNGSYCLASSFYHSLISELNTISEQISMFQIESWVEQEGSIQNLSKNRVSSRILWSSTATSGGGVQSLGNNLLHEFEMISTKFSAKTDANEKQSWNASRDLFWHGKP